MTRIVSLIALICIASSSLMAQNPTPAAPVLKNELPVGPPSLKGGSTMATNPATSANGDDETIRVETNLVTTPVSVLDRNGRFIPGLKKKDFKIFEDGMPQQITYFASEEQPFIVVLMIDISPSTKYKIDEIHYAALTFINQLRPTDKVMVVAFDQRVKVLTPEPTSDKQALYSAIYKSNFGSGTSLYEAVNFVTNLDLINVTGRKAVVLFTDGVDTTSRRANYESTVAAVQEVDALIYPIRYNTADNNTAIVRGPSGPIAALPPDIVAMLRARGLTIDPRAIRSAGGTSYGEYERGRLYLEALAQNTGGRMYDADSITNMEQSFKQVAEELRRQYSIGYYPENPGKPGDRKSVKIKVTRPGAVIRAKNGYVIRQART
ncbi:MAG: VWA domain-containing protein [Pyrinomonadaceae bacterium]